MNLWIEVAKLEGTTLRTLDRNNPFDVVKVNEQSVVVRPHVSGSERSIRRESIEQAFAHLSTYGELTRIDIRKHFTRFNPAYVAAILAALPEVNVSLKPITLHCQRDQ